MSQEGTPAPTGQEATPTMRSALVDAFDKLEQEQPSEQQPAPQARQEPAPIAGQQRDEAGRFKAKEAPTTPVEEQQLAQPEPWSIAPKSWKKELAEGWGKLDPAYQQYVHEREGQMKAGIEPLLPKAQLADAITQVAAPYMQTIQGLGLSLPQAIAGLMNVDHGLRTLPYEQKLQLLAQTALAYGIDLTGQTQYAQQTRGDPVFQATQHELVQLKGQFAQFLQQQEAQLQEAALDQIQRFSQTAEHFDAVKPMMAQLLDRGFATTIEEAYDKAIRLTPELFDQMQSARQAQTQQERSKAADDAAKRARAAAVSPKSATPGAVKPADARDRRSVLREQLDALSERL